MLKAPVASACCKRLLPQVLTATVTCKRHFQAPVAHQFTITVPRALRGRCFIIHFLEVCPLLREDVTALLASWKSVHCSGRMWRHYSHPGSLSTAQGGCDGITHILEVCPLIFREDGAGGVELEGSGDAPLAVIGRLCRQPANGLEDNGRLHQNVMVV